LKKIEHNAYLLDEVLDLDLKEIITIGLLVGFHQQIDRVFNENEDRGSAKVDVLIPC
jgi:hypothetical protein